MMTQTEDKRLKILDEEEITILYARPIFTDEERQRYFSLSPVESAAIKELTLKSRIYCILQLGYFKARQQFFVLDPDDVQVDLDYIRQLLFPAYEIDEAISKDTHTKHRRIVMELCRYRLCEAEERQKLEVKMAQLAKVSSKPIYVFRELLHFLASNRVVLPAYRPYTYAAVMKDHKEISAWLILGKKSRINS